MTPDSDTNTLDLEFFNPAEASPSEARLIRRILSEGSSLPLPGAAGSTWETPLASSPPPQEEEVFSPPQPALAPEKQGETARADAECATVNLKCGADRNEAVSGYRHQVPQQAQPSVASPIYRPSVHGVLPQQIAQASCVPPPQTIHINNYTANVNYPGGVGQPLYPLHHHPHSQPLAVPIGAPVGPVVPLHATHFPPLHQQPYNYVPYLVQMPPRGPTPAPFNGLARFNHIAPTMESYRQPQPQQQITQRMESYVSQAQPVTGLQNLSLNEVSAVPMSNEKLDGSQGIVFGSTPVVSLKRNDGHHDVESNEREVNDKVEQGNEEALIGCSTISFDQSSSVEDHSGKENITPSAGDIDQETEVFQAAPTESNHVSEDLRETDDSKSGEKSFDVGELPETVPTPVEPVKAISWASMVRSKGSADSHETSTSSSDPSPSKPLARIQPFAVSEQNKSPLSGQVEREKELGEFLKNFVPQFHATPLLPRGLTNRSNWCFVNSILQALLACPPLYNLLRSLPNTGWLAGGKSKTPMLDTLSQFVSEFSPLDLQVNKPLSGSGGKKGRNLKKEDVVTGVSLEPSYIYKMLLELEGTFKVVEGRQEDAEEFLTCLLNGLSEEMQALIKHATPDEEVNGENDNGQGEEVEEDDDDWQEVGAKGKSCITRRIAENIPGKKTPVESLALGMTRSCVKSEGGETSATLQPFYTLQLDIQDPQILNLTDALVSNFASEQLDGYLCAKTKAPLAAVKVSSLEELPPVLILHLKRFVYSATTGAVQKLLKPVAFTADLELPRSILSAECKAMVQARQRQYKLLSVVYHSGREAGKGHYLTSSYHPGYSCWLHSDDSIISPIPEQLVLQPAKQDTPYLLFYRRVDTISTHKTN